MNERIPTAPAAAFVDERQALQEALENARAAYQQAVTAESAAQARLHEHLSRADGKRRALIQLEARSGFDQDDLQQAREASEVAQAQADEARAQHVTQVERTAALNAQIGALERQVRDYAPAVTAAHVAAADAECERLRAEIKRYEGLIEAVALPARDDGDLQAARTERRRLLGDLAEGHGTEDALRTAEARLAELEAQAAQRAECVTRAEETRGALLERLERLAVALSGAVDQAQQLRTLRIASVQLAACRDYSAAAQAFLAAWVKADAADVLARSAGLPSRLGVNWVALRIPGAAVPEGGCDDIAGASALTERVGRAALALKATLA